jgi:hypothetical protein
LVAEHLRKFFGISVLKGAPLAGDRDASRQLAALDTMCATGAPVALLDPTRLLDAPGGLDEIGRLLAQGPLSAREAIRNIP